MTDWPAMQVRCVWCKREQYAMAVFGVSNGELGCSWCGRTAPIFDTEAEYREALRTFDPDKDDE